jgi:poly(3-hydroxybutyrate) depolymerase
MRIFVTLFVLLASLPTRAATIDDFEARQYKDAAGNTLLYRLYKPKDYDPAKKYPLVLFLHGAGERGTDNRAQVRDALHWARDEVQSANPSFILAPQCPPAKPAVQVYGTAKTYDQSHNDYAASAGQWKAYRVSLDKLPAGPRSFLTFINGARRQPAPPAGDGGASPKPVVSEFRNVRVYEDGADAAAIDFHKLAFDKRQGAGKSTLSDDGTTLTLTGDLRVKAPFAYTVTPKTVLAFEFRSPEGSQPGLAHAVGLDTDEFFDFRWANMDWSAKAGGMAKEPSVPLKLTLEALAALRKEFSVDEKRLYVTGLSMGGYGTWDVISRYPTLFAAAAPVCGGGDESVAPLIAKVPIWCFHGDADKTVPPERSRNMIEALRRAGGEPKYTEYPGVGHNSWDKAYAEPELATWLFEQRKR